MEKGQKIPISKAKYLLKKSNQNLVLQYDIFDKKHLTVRWVKEAKKVEPKKD